MILQHNPRIVRPLNGDEIADLHAAFEECDTDGDGFIHYQEFAALLQEAGSRLTDAERLDEFRRIDADVDGRIDLSEFKEWWSAG